MTPSQQLPMPPLTFWQGLHYSRDPRRVWYHFAQVRRAEAMLASLAATSRDDARAALREAMQDEPFLCEMFDRYQTIIGHRPRGTDFMFLWYEAGSLFFHGLVDYALVRLMQPAVVVETGGTPGNSSAFMLRAMERNAHGELHTVDLPPQGDYGDTSDGVWIHAGMPQGMDSGWAVPDRLRTRHHQHLGDARMLLPGVFEAVPKVQIFLHDSDHSYEHMRWEFETAWPHLAPGGALLADDVRANRAWDEFAARHGARQARAGGLGGLRKPAAGAD